VAGLRNSQSRCMKIRPNTLVTVLIMVCCLGGAGIGQRKGVAAIIAGDAPVMLLPEAGRTPLATLAEGTVVTVIGPEEDGWYQVSFQDSYLLGDRVGYVRVTSVRMPSAPSSGEAMSSGRSEVRRSAARPERVRNGLSDAAIATALSAAQREPGRSHGLRIGGPGGAAPPVTAAGDGMRGGIRLEIHTPLAWIQQLATDAAAHDRPFGPADVNDEMTEPVLRVTVYADVPAGSAGRPVPRPSPVHHVVLRAETGEGIVEPVSMHAFSQHVLSATGRTSTSEGLRVTFPLAAVQRLRGPATDRAVLITVVAADGDAKTVRVERKHLDALPM